MEVPCSITNWTNSASKVFYVSTDLGVLVKCPKSLDYSGTHSSDYGSLV